MKKVTETEKAECLKMQDVYKPALTKVSNEAKFIETEIATIEDELAVKEKKIELAFKYIQISNYFCNMADIALNKIDSRMESTTTDARIALSTSVTYLEDTFGLDVNGSLLTNSEVHEHLENKITDQYKYKIIIYLCYTSKYLKHLFGENSKWKWNLIEIDKRIAILAKNMIDYKTYIKNTNPAIDGYKERVKTMILIKKLISKSIDAYRIKYEVTDKNDEDMLLSINMVDVLRSIANYLGEVQSAEDFKKTHDSLKRILEANQKKSS